MDANNTFSCFLIGADTLLIECGDILRQRGHRILGVITRASRIAQWARKYSIPVIDLDSGYLASLQQQEYDYLFSITHLEMIADEALKTAKKLAINFHDGPLPRYAGLNTPAWALINQEAEYGISWHMMQAGVDQGDLLQQQLFPIAADETSISLNTQCFAAALEGFPRLLAQLEADQPQRTPQNLAERSYFGKFQRPAQAAMIDWQQPAAAIEALVRALDFGDYANPLACPKSFFDGALTLISRAKASEEHSDVAPGSVIAVDEGTIKVATGEGVLNITQLRGICGRTFSPGEFAKLYGMAAGQTFTSLPTTQLQALEQLNTQLCRSEEYWLKQLARLEPAEIPYARTDLNPSEVFAHLDLNLNGAIETTIAAFAVLLARLGQKSLFHLGFVDPALNAASTGLEALVSQQVVLPLAVAEATPAGHQLALTAETLATVRKKGSWMRDLIARHPELRSIPELTGDNLLPIGIAIADTPDIYTPAASSLLTLVLKADGSAARFVYDERRLHATAADKLAAQLKAIAEGMQQHPQRPVGQLDLLSDAERQRILVDWNRTAKDYDKTLCIHTLFEQQVAAHPDKTALVFEDHTLSYAELNARANQLAAYLKAQGIGPDLMVGVNIERSLELMVATLGVMKAGGAYVPLDPAFPADRLAYMIEDAGMPVILSQQSIADRLQASNAKVVRIDSDWPEIAQYSDAPIPDNAPNTATSSNLAYVIYTSGSTGKPKGVMVEHRNAINFFVGMDERIPFDDDSVWLAVTSLSFDISVLELFWTLTRGLKVVIYKDNDKTGGAAKVPTAISNRPMEFGLFMWGNDDAAGSAKYRLMMEGAKFFDENGFDAVWTPERHFHAFGGPFPNPAVTGAAIAAITQNVGIRSGSVVSPLHHAIRIAEDWAVIDNLSDGRVGLSFAAGWQPNDFVIMPQNHGNNKKIMFEQIEIVRKLWRGEKVAFQNPMGDMVDVLTLPRPVQKELPVWVTTAGNPESYRQAGEIGANVLTHLLGQTVEELAEKIAIYRKARTEAGLDPKTGKISLMLHTFVGEDIDEVRELVREPMKDYLRSSMKLVIDFAWTFPAFKRPGGVEATPDDIDIKGLSDEDKETILDFAFERYFETSGLFGTPDVCLQMINRCKKADVDEIACLLDYGIETDRVMDSLPLLKQVRDLANPLTFAAEADSAVVDQSFAAQVVRHNVTHFQCTPSHARMLTFDDSARKALAGIQHMMVGGEALPANLAAELTSLLSGDLTNMYGPTETTIWSTTQPITAGGDITIGRPIANTQIYILDSNKQPVPTGVPGDLYIGGDGVVRGYLNRPELTAERFIPNPYASHPQGQSANDRIYWTGDMARYRDDGSIDFLGRVDFQVKIRGYRIELGEIEALLGKHPAVRENVLLLREDTPGDQRLAAYMLTNGEAPDTNELKAYLRANLPEYMVPSDFVVLEELPLTPNGKIDRRALPSPQSLQKAATAKYAAPEDELQQTIVKLWQDTLNVEKVGINDNFFDLGGHSLLIVKIHSQLKALIEQPVALTDLYGYPTIRALTQFLKSGGSGASLQKSTDRAARRRQMMGRRRR